MASRGRKRTREDDSQSPNRGKATRISTLYDAVAGRVGYETFLKPDQLDSLRGPKPPDQVLYRREAAPLRYEEDDEYYKEAHLSSAQRLPDSDLVEALHAYSSDFYQHATEHAGKHDWQSMDETALLALGVLLEETVSASLGETGDLAFVEGDDADAGNAGRGYWNGRTWTRSVIQRHATGPRTKRPLVMSAADEAVNEADSDVGKQTSSDEDSSDE